MNRPATRIVLTVLLVVTAAALATAEATSIENVARELGAVFQWDPYRRIGFLWRGSEVVSVKPNVGVAVLNMKEIVSIEEIRHSHGRLLVPDSTVETLSNMLSVPEEPARKISAVFIDPGHGGKDPGAIGLAGTTRLAEKDVVLQVGRRLHALLSRTYPDREVIMSRSDDTYVTLEGRTEMANAVALEENESILFVSIHANASFNRKARGYEVWYLPPEYRRTLLDVETVGRENRDILPILNTIKEEEITVESVLLARSILKGLDRSVGRETENRGLKEESWFVVRNARMPSVLVEVGFVTHSAEVALLQDDDYLQRVARGIYNGIVAFIREYELRE
jgi:N-acetylmuramoyl-L-alanine amidase